MKKTLIGLALLLAACGGVEAPEAAPAPPPAPAPAPAPAPEPEPEKEPGAYGDDETLDKLWDACEEGSLEACEELFWDSPIDSEYEQYALRRVNELEGVAPATGTDIIDELGAGFILDIVWAGMSNAEKDDLCLGLEVFGPEASAQIIVSEAPDFDPTEVAEWLIQTCR